MKLKITKTNLPARSPQRRSTRRIHNKFPCQQKLQTTKKIPPATTQQQLRVHSPQPSSRPTSPFREEASQLNRPKQGRMGKRLLRPCSSSAGAPTLASSPHTLSQGETQMITSEDSSNKDIDQHLDQHMENTTLPTTTDSLVPSQTEVHQPHVMNNGHTHTEMRETQVHQPYVMDNGHTHTCLLYTSPSPRD